MWVCVCVCVCVCVWEWFSETLFCVCGMCVICASEGYACFWASERSTHVLVRVRDVCVHMSGVCICARVGISEYPHNTHDSYRRLCHAANGEDDGPYTHKHTHV